MAVTQYSLRVVKHFTYRGDDFQQWSNRYYFDGGAPTDSDAWHALMDAVTTAEKAIHTGGVIIDAAHGYAPGSDLAVATKSYSLAGTLSSTGGETPGDCAAVLRMATTKVSTKNHPVYCYSYFHNAMKASGDSSGDVLAADQKAAIETYGSSWKDGITVGGRTYKRTTPDGHLTTGVHVDQYIGHRDFPR